MKASGLGAMIRNRLRRKEIYSKAGYWDAKATDYADDSVSWWPNNHLNTCYNREQIDLLNGYLSDVLGRSVLDLGCGTGRISRYLAGPGATVHGMDFSRSRSSSPGSTGPNPSYETGSVFDLDHEQRYDAVVVFGVLVIACQTRAELLDVLRRICLVLKPAGTLVLMEPVHNGFLHRVLKMPLAGVPRRR